jgi:hypothetical protein
MPKITFKKLSNLSEAEAAWKSLSPNQVLYDDWDFRYCYYKYLNFPLEFTAGYDGDTLIGLLPLMWDPHKKVLDFFAGVNYMEENRVFTRPGYESYVNDFFAQVTKHAILEDMHESMKNVPGTVFHEDSYSLDLSPYATIDEYLSQAWTGNHGKQFRKHIRHIEHDGVVLQDGTIDDLDLLFDFNIVRFGNESSFIVRPFWKEFHRDIAKQFNTKITIVKREEETIAVGLSLIYNTKYYGITSGWNSPITNLGKFLLVKKIDEAIHLKASTFEAGTGDYGWKELFGLAKHPLYLKETK